MNKVYIHRVSSTDIDSLFVDESFDIIYIDGNHTSYFVLQDAVLSLKKLKVGGTVVFDDVFDKEVRVGLEAFLSVSKDFLDANVPCSNGQIFLKKNATMLLS